MFKLCYLCWTYFYRPFQKPGRTDSVASSSDRRFLTPLGGEGGDWGRGRSSSGRPSSSAAPGGGSGQEAGEQESFRYAAQVEEVRAWWAQQLGVESGSDSDY